MEQFYGAMARILTLVFVALSAFAAQAQIGGAGSVHGTVTDPTGAVVPGATAHLFNKASGFDRGATSDPTGQFNIPNVPYGPMVEDTSTFHTDVDRDQFNKIPLESVSSALSSLVTQTTPGVSADSNGMFHGLGDHASNSFSVDGQPITDQQFEAGLMCNGVAVTSTSGFGYCPASQYSSSLVKIPAPGTENNDRNPPRVAPRSLLDVSAGKSNLFHANRYKLDFDLTAINVANKYALYNFLSTSAEHTT